MAGAIRRRAAGARQHVRDHGDDGPRHAPPRDGRRRRAGGEPDRPAAAGSRRLPRRSGGTPRSSRDVGGDPGRRRRRRARVSRQGGADAGAFRRGPVPAGSGTPRLPLRRPRARDSRRRTGVSRADRRPGQDPRLPRRAGRGRLRPRRASRRPRGHRPRAAGPRGGVAGGIRDPARGFRLRRGGAAPVPAPPPPGLHDLLPGARRRSVSADAARQARPRSPSAPRGESPRRRGLRRPAHGGGGAGRVAVFGSDRFAPGRRGRRLLQPRRAFAGGDARRGAAARSVPGRGRAEPALRTADAGEARRVRRGAPRHGIRLRPARLLFRASPRRASDDVRPGEGLPAPAPPSGDGRLQLRGGDPLPRAPRRGAAGEGADADRRAARGLPHDLSRGERPDVSKSPRAGPRVLRGPRSLGRGPRGRRPPGRRASPRDRVAALRPVEAPARGVAARPHRGRRARASPPRAPPRPRRLVVRRLRARPAGDLPRAVRGPGPIASRERVAGRLRGGSPPVDRRPGRRGAAPFLAGKARRGPRAARHPGGPGAPDGLLVPRRPVPLRPARRPRRRPARRRPARRPDALHADARGLLPGPLPALGRRGPRHRRGRRQPALGGDREHRRDALEQRRVPASASRGRLRARLPSRSARGGPRRRREPGPSVRGDRRRGRSPAVAFGEPSLAGVFLLLRGAAPGPRPAGPPGLPRGGPSQRLGEVRLERHRALAAGPLGRCRADHDPLGVFDRPLREGHDGARADPVSGGDRVAARGPGPAGVRGLDLGRGGARVPARVRAGRLDSLSPRGRDPGALRQAGFRAREFRRGAGPRNRSDLRRARRSRREDRGVPARARGGPGRAGGVSPAARGRRGRGDAGNPPGGGGLHAAVAEGSSGAAGAPDRGRRRPARHRRLFPVGRDSPEPG